MTITDTCPCGATFNASSQWNNGAVIERHKDWLTAHALCRSTEQYNKIYAAERGKAQ